MRVFLTLRATGTSNTRQTPSTISLRLTVRRDIEGDRDTLAFSEGTRAVPHPRREQGEASQFRLNQSSGREVYSEFCLRLSQRQPAGMVRASQVWRKDNV